MNRLPRVLYRVGSIGCLVTAGLHLIGHAQGLGAAANADEATLYRLLTTYVFDLGGSKRTIWELYEGFSLSWSTFIFFVGILDLAILRLRRDDGGLLRMIAGINAAFFGLLLVISVRNFILPPTICLTVIAVAFAASLVPGGRS